MATGLERGSVSMRSRSSKWKRGRSKPFGKAKRAVPRRSNLRQDSSMLIPYEGSGRGA